MRFLMALCLAILPAAARAAGYAGLWDTSFGRMRLLENGDKIQGLYDYSGGGEVSGAIKDGKLVLRYKDASDKGIAEFALSPDGLAFTGRWREKGDKEWRTWDGVRVEPDPKRRWLYVLESRWEDNLADREYSYGQMLKTFFDYSQKVEVRQRFFSDRTSLLRWLRQAAFLAEPVVVYISAHGTDAGVESDSGPVGGKLLGEALRWAPTVRLLHFGSCEIMKGRTASEILARLPQDARFPISGFTETVDWAGSAVADLMYLNLILDDGFEPELAAKELAALMPYTVTARKGSPIGPIGFKLTR